MPRERVLIHARAASIVIIFKTHCKKPSAYLRLRRDPLEAALRALLSSPNEREPAVGLSAESVERPHIQRTASADSSRWPRLLLTRTRRRPQNTRSGPCGSRARTSAARRGRRGFFIHRHRRRSRRLSAGSSRRAEEGSSDVSPGAETRAISPGLGRGEPRTLRALQTTPF